MSLRARMADAGRFMVRPTPGREATDLSVAVLAVLALVFALELTIDVLAGETFMGRGSGFLPSALQRDTTLAEDIFKFLLIAPLLEELVYRGWLSGRVAALRFALYGFAAEALLVAALFLDDGIAHVAALAAAGVALAGLVQWLATRHDDTAVPPWFTRHFHWYVWGSSLAFGLIHLGNYEPITSPLGLLVVLPQTIGGLVLAYARTRLGLGAAMLHHAAYNAVFLAVEFGW